MNLNSMKMIFGGIIALVGILYVSTFIVDRTEYAIEIQLGKPVNTYTEPGLKFKVPFITNVVLIDNRLLSHDAEPRAIITKDKKSMIVDNYSRWKVVDPLKFYETMRGEGARVFDLMNSAQKRLKDIIYSQTREVLGRYTLAEIVATNRSDLMKQITENSKEATKAFGIELVDVRIKRADLPEENSRAVFSRMDEERRRVAKRYRSEGGEQALGIRSTADRERVTIMAEAQKESEEIRGKADALAVTIYAEAYKVDPEFYKFLRSQEIYRSSLQEGTTILMSSEHPFFQYLR